ncbi:hypothetical protein BGW42_007865 [Actinomortierella wolfii]|nr:hypothetical protein BGW42_007865 [Actinomortierella wolfii]
MVPSNDMFHSVATSIFGTQDELVNGMKASVDNTTLTTLPPDELEELMIIEAKVNGTEVAALPPPMSPEIARRLANKGLNPTWTDTTTTILLNHLPRVSKNTMSFNIPMILDESATATRYFASLGNNFILDWEGSMLYVIFDTVETLKGYEIPDWLFFLTIGIISAGAIFWFVFRLIVDRRYWKSLYMTMSSELSGNDDGAKPRLHQFNPITFKFDEQHQLVTSELSPQPSSENASNHDLTSADSNVHLTAY